MKIRINKYLSMIGICSRRHADDLIQKGQVKINSCLAKLGDKVDDQDEITVNDKKIINNKVFLIKIQKD
jgi:16S rRNA U516 pseudouridylate synthase RsuA-like enzyme